MRSTSKTPTTDLDVPSTGITEPRAARYIGLTYSGLRAWRLGDKGQLDRRGPRYYMAGRLVRYRKVDLDNWIEAHLVDPAA